MLPKKMKVPEQYRIKTGIMGSDESYGNNGSFKIPFESFEFSVIASDQEGWEHVSVALPNRNPNWREMCFFKNLFWGEDICVIQFHPPKAEYINNHPHCLHLWKPIDKDIETPPYSLVGVKE